MLFIRQDCHILTNFKTVFLVGQHRIGSREIENHVYFIFFIKVFSASLKQVSIFWSLNARVGLTKKSVASSTVEKVVFLQCKPFNYIYEYIYIYIYMYKYKINMYT